MRIPNHLLSAALCVLTSPAAAMVTEGNCAIVVASRASIAEVDLFERLNPHLNVTEVYEASNGWFAISIGEVALTISEQRLSDLKSRGAVPPDTFCSSGKNYPREVSNLPAQRGDLPGTTDSALVAPFDARPMDLQEKRFLQSALAYMGYYAGLLDGSWGQGSQRALDAFTFASQGTEATNGDAAILMMTAMEVYRQERWEYRHFGQYGVSIFLPTANLEWDQSDGAGLALENPVLGVSVYLTRGGAGDMAGYHQRFEAQHDGLSEFYSIRERDRWVTAATWDSEAHYLRSELFDGAWTSVFVSALPAPHSPVNLVVGSITRDPGADIVLPRGGHARRQIATVAQVTATPPANPSTPPSTAPIVTPAPVPSSSPMVAAPLPGRAEWDDRFAPFYINTSDPTSLYLDGPIDARSALAFSRALDELSDARTLVLSSPGGNVYSALLIAREIDRRGLATLIPQGSACYSACSFLYLAGHQRGAKGSLGVHQISSDNPDLVSGQIALSDIVEILDDFSVPNDLIVLMLRTPPEDMYVLSPEELSRYGLIGARTAGAASAALPPQEDDQSDGPLLAGTYRDGGLSVVIEGELVGVTVGEAGCFGQFDGAVREEAGQISFVGEGCAIAVTRLGPFDFSMEQGPGCSDYHGAACSLSGYVRRQ